MSGERIIVVVLLPMLFVLSVSLLSITGAQTRQYHLGQEWAKIWINQDGTIDLFYNISITLESGPSISHVYIGQPNGDFTISETEDQDGHILSAADASSGSDYKVQVNLATPLSTGQTVWFTLLTNVAHVIHEDNETNVGMHFIPTWWSEAQVLDLRVLIVLPSGVNESMVKTSVNWDDILHESDGRMSVLWERQNLQPGQQFDFGVSFPKEYLQIYERIGRVRNIDTRLNYTTIQEAINAQETLDGHTILVDAGTYYGSITLNKSLCLMGQDKATTVIDGNGTNKVLVITADNSSIGDFTIQGGVNIDYEVSSAIYVNSSNNLIVRNVLRDNDDYAVWVDSFSNNNTIEGNNVTRCWRGCMLKNSTDNRIAGNSITEIGQECISLWNSSHNQICSNLMKGRAESGIAFTDAYNNNVTDNTFDDALFGIKLENSYNNSLCHNNFLNNSVSQVRLYSFPGINSFDNGFEGNYWSDYNGTDVNHDGVGDELYCIDENNADNYPLMGKISFFPLFGDYTIVSNSTIVDFYAMHPYPGLPRLDINVTGPVGTTGFCRVSISKDYMTGPYNVTVNGDSTFVPELPSSNNTTAYLYFTYNHPVSGNITIVSEFPSFLILPLCLMTTLLVIVVYEGRDFSGGRQQKTRELRETSPIVEPKAFCRLVLPFCVTPSCFSIDEPLWLPKDHDSVLLHYEVKACALLSHLLELLGLSCHTRRF